MPCADSFNDIHEIKCGQAEEKLEAGGDEKLIFNFIWPNVRAKVTDFGMARLGDQTTRATQLTFTMCPGTDAYMPPEAVQDKPVYTEKIDCFSFGVISVHIVTRQFPKPRDRQITLNDPRYPQGAVKLCVPEIERRQNHISTIDPNHPLKQIALDCLKDRDVERPSAQRLCERVAALKEGPPYRESVRVVEARSTAERDRSVERDREIRSLRQQHSRQVQGLRQIIQSQINHLAENVRLKDQIIEGKNEIITQIEREKDETVAELRQQIRQLERERRLVIRDKERELRQKMDVIDRLERQLGRVNQQLEESERVNTQFQRRIVELEQLRPTTDASSSSQVQRDTIKLTWRRGKKAPCKVSNSYCAAVDGSTLYVHHPTSHQMLTYTVSTSSWSQLPNSPTKYCSIVVINNLLTLVGGRNQIGIHSSQLFSLTGEGSGRRWTEEFPPMPTERAVSTALYTGGALIVAGGSVFGGYTRKVEVLNIETLRWSTAAHLPDFLSHAPAAVCGDQIYVMGNAMYACSIQSLLASTRSSGGKVWKAVSAPPVELSTCVSIHDRLLAIGGCGSNRKLTTAVHMYNPTTDSWEVISHMRIPRHDCIAAVLPNNQLMVVGGYFSAHEVTDSVEFALVEE